jgi:hypothetical protein
MMRKIFLLAALATAIASCTTTNQDNKNTVSLSDAKLCGDESISTNFGQIDIENNFLTDESSAKLYEEMDLQRAAQAYLWSLPAVELATWKIEQNEVYGTDKLGSVAIFETFQEKKGIVTANLTTPYVITFIDLAKSPVVINYPAGKTAGALLDLWQRPAMNMGLSGDDKGKGGKYILVGPEDNIIKYKKEGYFTHQSPSNLVMLALRFIDPDEKAQEAFKASLQIGRFGEDLINCSYVENLDKEWSATPYRGIQYWETLSEIINNEPVRDQDKPWLAMLEPLGIVKGQKFNPTEKQKEILLKGVALGELMARNIQVNPRFAESYWPGTQWEKCFHFPIEQEDSTKIYIDERLNWFYEAVTSSQQMVYPQVGQGQVYMTTKRDSEGHLFRADKTYKLTVPKDVPMKQFWALTLYSENTRRPYDNGEGTARSANLDSKDKDLKYNEDGSVDLYIGPKAPEGYENNLMKTVGSDGWFIYFRLYAPTEPFFDKTFSLPDFIRVD